MKTVTLTLPSAERMNESPDIDIIDGKSCIVVPEHSYKETQRLLRTLYANTAKQ